MVRHLHPFSSWCIESLVFEAISNMFKLNDSVVLKGWATHCRRLFHNHHVLEKMGWGNDKVIPRVYHVVAMWGKICGSASLIEPVVILCTDGHRWGRAL